MNVDVKETIKDVSIEEVASRLGLNLTKHGHSLKGQCPTGHSSKSGTCFSINLSGNYFQCFNCREAGDVIRLVEITNGLDFTEALHWLVDRFHPELLPRLEKSQPKRDADENEYYRRAALYEKAYEYGRNQLYMPIGQAALDYLVNERGYAVNNLKQTEWMYFPPDDDIRSFLCHTDPEPKPFIDKLHLQGSSKDEFRLAFPYRDRRGVISGFVKRSIDPGAEKRWDSTFGLKKQDLFNLCKCEDRDTVIIVEGYPDALYLPTLGMKNVVAVGQGRLSESHLPGLRSKGIRNAIIAFDNDAVGPENTEKAVKLLEEADFKAFVVSPGMYGGHKDPDELVKSEGIAAFRAIVSDAVKGHEWMFYRTIEGLDEMTDLEKEGVKDELFQYAQGINDALDLGGFYNLISETFNIREDLIQLAIEQFEERKAREEFIDNTRRFARQLSNLVEDKDFDALREHLTEKVGRLNLDFIRAGAKNSVPLDVHLAQKYEDEKTRGAGLLGYALNKFRAVAECTDGIQPGYYLLAAGTNIGKTAVSCNLALDLIETNPDVRLHYYSLDDSRDVIINRLLGIHTDIPLNGVQRRQQTDADQKLLKDAYDFFIDLCKSGRLQIKDLAEVTHVNDLEIDIREHADKNMVVFIDGLYNLEMGSGHSGIREENIARANQIKLLVDTYRIPILCTGELRKNQKSDGENKKPTIHDLMETGKFAYNVNLAWLLRPDNMNEFKAQDEPTIIMDFAKNKLSHFKNELYFKFIKKTGKIEPILHFASGSVAVI